MILLQFLVQAMYYTSKKHKSGGRIYNSELYMTKEGKLSIYNMERGVKMREFTSASQIYRMEIYLSSGIRSKAVTTKEETKRIAEKYRLEKHPCEGNPKYKGDIQFIYDELRRTFTNVDWDSRFPNHDGKGYKRLVYALLYGENRCTVIKKEDK